MAQGWLVYSITKSSFYLGLAGMAQALPILLFTLFGGIFADRYNRRKIMLFTQTLSIFPPLILFLLNELNIVSIWHIIFLAFVMGSIHSIDIPVRQSFLPIIIGKKNLLSAIALNSVAFHGARVIGPTIAGFLINMYGVSICFFTNVISFLPIIYVLYKMDIVDHLPGSSSNKSLFHDLKEGFSFILKDKQITFVILNVCLFSVFAFPFSHFLPVFADKVFNTDVKGLGYLMASIGVGSLFAGLVLAFRGDIKGKVLYMAVAGACFPVSLMLVSMINSFLVACFLIAISGWSSVSFLATTNSFLQLKSTDLLRGRVISVFSLSFLGVMPVGYYIFGVLADFLGIQSTVMVCAIISFCGFILFNRRWGEKIYIDRLKNKKKH